MPHLRYLKYVLLHKLYVLLGGIAIARVQGSVYERPWWRWPGWIARLLVHDLSKFRPSEWGPYVARFYGPSLHERVRIERERSGGEIATQGDEARAREQVNEVNRRFDVAWLKHQHRNPHHWQHWILREDSGRTKAMLFPAVYADEMLADWLGAGTKILAWPTIAECVAATVVWYAEARKVILLRAPAQQRIEETMLLLCQRYGLVDMAQQVQVERAARESITIPGR